MANEPAAQGLTGNWSQAFEGKGPGGFAALLAENVVLEASAIRKPAVGREAVLAIMGAGSRLYREITFSDPATAGDKTYAEWHAISQDGDTAYDGVTVLTTDKNGAIVHVAVHHRPLDALLRFSAEIGRALDGKLPAALFHDDE
ncbi:nuclear transport factor 2 family protein [Streptomyces liangshanensis]|uniref:Nuclear transport factor 2 family protein n=1 Tax=Streptomyces liangshanensis TaxID=2717324 RepID=A0A6G9GSP6_9ACTN|nr:nuclear transport factor 2 family protein [Streptomyces liangshanensis]QIQ01268.1 nuclear transport factor 2 family protein [Streptomyces liangshanensis]